MQASNISNRMKAENSWENEISNKKKAENSYRESFLYGP